VVTYKVVFPEATDKNFEEGGTYAPNFEYIMRFDDMMADISAEDITLDSIDNIIVRVIPLKSIKSFKPYAEARDFSA